MALSVSRDDSVCSLMRIRGFGEKYKGGYDYNAPVHDSEATIPTLKHFLIGVRERIAYYDEMEPNRSNKFYNQGLITAVASGLQPKAMKTLREFGGWTEQSSNDMVKYAHEVTIFTMSIRDFAERFNKHSRDLGLGLKEIVIPDKR